MLEVSEKEDVVVALHLTSGPLTICSGLKDRSFMG